MQGMRWFKTLRTPALFSRVHGFMRNLFQGFCEYGAVQGNPHLPRAPRLMRAWDDLMQTLWVA
jgi:hypothetical protein